MNRPECIGRIEEALKVYDKGPGAPWNIFDEIGDFFAAANPSALKELLVYVRELEKDAGRYRWLRDEAYFLGSDDDSDSPWIVAGTCYEDCRPVFDKEADLLVDAAIASQSKDKQ